MNANRPTLRVVDVGFGPRVIADRGDGSFLHDARLELGCEETSAILRLLRGEVEAARKRGAN